MTTLLYRYDPQTREYLESFVPLNDLQLTSYPHTTEVVPLPSKPGYAVIFDELKQQWWYLEDHRGQQAIDVNTKCRAPWTRLGPLPATHTLVLPKLAHLPYLRFDPDTGQWEFDEQQRDYCLGQLLQRRRELRQEQVDRPLTYHEHQFIVTPDGLVELLVARQTVTDYTYVTDAAGQMVRLTAAELQELLANWDQRRQTLDWTLTTAWEQDQTRPGTELLNCLDELESALVEQYSKGD